MIRLSVIAMAVAGPLVASAAIDYAFLKSLLEIPSVSADASSVNRAVDLTRSWLEKTGVCCQVETNAAGRTALYASTRPGKVQDYLLVTHLDVVPAGPEQFKPRFECDRVYARGAHDCKGNAVLAAQVLKDLNGKASVGAVFAGDEEIGGFTTKMMVERGYGAKKLIVILDAGTYGVFYAEKGNYYLHVRAVGRGGHSSAAPWLKNPIDRLADGYLKFMAAWPKVPADGWGDVISATLVSAGEAENRIPDTAEMTLNLRSVTADAPERAAKLLKVVGGLEVVRVDESAKPVTSDVNDPEIVRFLAARKAFWPEKKPGFQRMLAATDARHFTASGVPIVITGTMGANAHAQDEWQDLKSIDENAEMLERYFGRNRLGMFVDQRSATSEPAHPALSTSAR